MRFLVLTQYFPPEVGAPQVRLAAMARELRRMGHEVELVTAMPNYPVGRIYPGYRGRLYLREQWEGVTVHRTWIYGALGRGIKRVANYLSFTLTSLLGLLRATRPDYVFVESPPLFLGISGWLAARRWGAPMIFNVADLWPDSIRDLGALGGGRLLRIFEWLEGWCYRRSAFVNAITEGIRASLIEQKGLSPDKVLFLPNGVDTELFRPAEPDAALARELGLEGRPVIVYAGTLGLAQGLDVWLDALLRLQDEFPTLALLFVGGGSDKARLVQRARDLRLDQVRFLDPVPLAKVAAVYSIATAGAVSLVSSPVMEGARPSKVYPIMASGKPVLYSGAGEGARLIAGARAGLVSAPGDAPALADCMRTLLRDPALCRELGAGGRAYATAQLTWGRIMTDWVAQLEARRSASQAAATPTPRGPVSGMR